MITLRRRALARPLCAGVESTFLPPLTYDDQYIKSILGGVTTVAILGASPNYQRPSFYVMEFMQARGYRCVPVNPKAASAGIDILGERAYASLEEASAGALGVGHCFHMVDVFRNSAAVGGIADEAIAHGARVLWTQLGVRDDAAAARASKAGLQVIMDRCPKIELSRLYHVSGPNMTST